MEPLVKIGTTFVMDDARFTVTKIRRHDVILMDSGGHELEIGHAIIENVFEGGYCAK